MMVYDAAENLEMSELGLNTSVGSVLLASFVVNSSR